MARTTYIIVVLNYDLILSFVYWGMLFGLGPLLQLFCVFNFSCNIQKLPVSSMNEKRKSDHLGLSPYKIFRPRSLTLLDPRISLLKLIIVRIKINLS